MSGSVDPVTTLGGTSSQEEDGEDRLMTAGGTVPVGVTIAYQRREKGLKDETMRRTPKGTPSTSAKKKSSRSSAKKSGKKHHHHEGEEEHNKSTSFQVFVESAAIYFTCLLLPTVLGYLYSIYDVWQYERTTGGVVLEDVQEEVSTYDQYYHWLTSSVYDPVASYMCDDGSSGGGGEASYSYAWSLVSPLITKTGFCPSASDLLAAEEKRSVLSDDVSAWTDVFTIAVCSFLLAVVRIAIVQYTVPMEDADKLEAMVRVKSDHILRSSYLLTPTGTPQAKRTIQQIPEEEKSALMVPGLNSNAGADAGAAIQEDEMFGVNIDASEREDEDPSTRDMLGVNPSMTSQEDKSFDSALLPDEASASPPQSQRRNRMYAAPRYATAVFRLLFSTCTAAIALIYFRGADFWPWYVLGHGSTAKCWDLSGGMSVGMDSDFDQRNAVLKRYFLWQASYHWHSGAFHILSLLILLLHPTKHAPRRFLSFQNSSTAYVKSLTQHMSSVALIAVAYVFSSLRRLVAIGMFAFDVSSWFLHLLQVCINAPEDSRLKRREIVSSVYWVLVIPSFVVARFMIWPAIWYSAAFESTFWLTQLEKTLWPGSAALLRNTIHFFMAIVLAMSVIYFRRLLTHQQLQRFLRRPT